MAEEKKQSQRFLEIDDQIDAFIRKIAHGMLSSSDVKEKSDELAQIYECGFSRIDRDCYRHTYSRFWALVSEISSQSSLSPDGRNESTACLSYNLNEIRRCILDNYVACSKRGQPTTSKTATKNEGSNSEESKGSASTRENKAMTGYVKNAVSKLYDHISLEIARLEDFRKIVTETEQIAGIREDISKLRNEQNSATKELSKATKKAGSLQNDVISVLGIFSAISLAVTGGLSFTTSAISSLHDIENPYRLYLTLILVGFVLCNLIFGLMYCVGKLTGKTVLSPCECNTESNGNCDPCKKCSILKKVKRRLPFCFFVNIVFVIFALLILLGWAFDAVAWVDKFNDFGGANSAVASETDALSNADVTKTSFDFILNTTEL